MQGLCERGRAGTDDCPSATPGMPQSTLGECTAAYRTPHILRDVRFSTVFFTFRPFLLQRDVNGTACAYSNMSTPTPALGDA